MLTLELLYNWKYAKNFFEVSLQHCSRSSPWTLSGLGLITEKPQKKDKNKVLQHFVDVLLSVLINLLMIQSLTFALPASLTLEICIQIMFSMIHRFPETQIDQMKSKLLFNITSSQSSRINCTVLEQKIARKNLWLVLFFIERYECALRVFGISGNKLYSNLNKTIFYSDWILENGLIIFQRWMTFP